MKRNKKMVIISVFLIALIVIAIIGVLIRNNIKEENVGTAQNEKTEMMPLPEPENNPVEITEINSITN